MTSNVKDMIRLSKLPSPGAFYNNTAATAMLSRSAFKSTTRFPTTLFGRVTIAKISTAHPRLSNSTKSITDDDAHNILVAQRKRRPVSPHLSIYQPQLTWYGSAMNRITGAVLSAGIYAFFAAYSIAPIMGWPLDSTSLAAEFGGFSTVAKVGIKSLVAFPFTYHSWNGIRYLIWDTGKMLDIKDVYRSGYVVFGLTAVSTLYLAFI